MTTMTAASATATPTSEATCHLCGAVFEVQIPPGAAKAIASFVRSKRAICDGCAKKHLGTAETRERIKNAYERLENARQAGRITAATKAASFKRSFSWMEKPNQAAWDYCRAKRSRAQVARESLVFFGGPGTGKSYLARCLLVYASWLKISVGDTNARQLIRAGKSWKSGHFDYWKRCGLLLLDDIDKADWRQGDSLEILWETLDARANSSLRTIATSNMPPVDLKAYLKEHRQGNGSLADAALERLRPYKAFEFAGQSMRQKTAGDPKTTGENGT